MRIGIRTYGVVTLNEECGFVQWVPNTIPLRPVLLKLYDARGIKSWVWLAYNIHVSHAEALLVKPDVRGVR
jgi:phosphatidylinositol kinase/protein kinase (PI-3  family)